MTNADSILMALLRLAMNVEIGEDAKTALAAATPEDWRNVIDESFDHGVALVALDGLHKAQDEYPEFLVSFDDESIEDAKYEWFGYVFDGEEEYASYKRKLEKLCGFFSDKGLIPIVVKGYGLSLNYPIPEHRPVGDIDVFLVGAENASVKGDQLVKEKLGIKVTKARNMHHSHFVFKGVTVENHYELGNTYFGDKRSKRLELAMRELVGRDYSCGDVALPGGNFNAVFLMAHMADHFTGEKVILRHLCDWMMMLKHFHREIDWGLVRGIWKDAGMEEFTVAVCGACTKYLGMPEEWMPGVKVEDGLVDCFMESVFAPKEEGGRLPFLMIPRYYMNKGWRYRITARRHWWIPMLRNGWMHIFHPMDEIEKEL